MVLSLIVAILLVVFVALQPQQINKLQNEIDLLKNQSANFSASQQQQNYEINLLQTELTMMMSPNISSTLIESGVCRVIRNNVLPSASFVSYKLYTNNISQYVVFSNTTFIPLASEFHGFPCPYTPSYIHTLLFGFGACTTDLTGNTFTISQINSINVVDPTAGPKPNTDRFFPFSEQEKIVFPNNTVKIFGRDGACYQNTFSETIQEGQYIIYVPTTSVQNAFTNGNFRTKLFNFQAFLQNSTTGFQLVNPLMVFLSFGNYKQ